MTIQLLDDDKQFAPPYIVIPMPLDKRGDGPEMNVKQVHRMVWEVWDASGRTVSTHRTERKAIRAKEELESICSSSSRSNE